MIELVSQGVVLPRLTAVSKDEPASAPPRDQVTLGKSELRVTHFTPAGAGQFVRARKFHTCLQHHLIPNSGPSGAVFCESADDGRFLTRATQDGEVLYRVPLLQDEHPRSLYGAADGSRAYLLSDKRILGVDVESGHVVGEIPLTGYATRKLLPRPDGKVMFSQGNSLVWYDRNLQEVDRRECPWEVKDFQPLADGGLILSGSNDFYHLGHLQVVDANGKELFASEQVRPATVAVAENGDVLLLEWKKDEWSVGSIRIDPRSGTIGRCEVPKDKGLKAIFPQKNGTYVIYGRDYNDITSDFLQCAADGKVLRSYHFEREGRPGNFLADPQRQCAYVRICSNDETLIYRLDLSAAPPAEGEEVTPRLLCREKSMVVTTPVLDDGRLIVFSPRKVRVFGADGSVQQQYDSLGAVQDAFREAPPQLGQNMILGEGAQADGAATLRMWLSVAAANLPFVDNREFVDPQPQAGQVIHTADRCINFARLEDGAAAMQEMRLPDESVYQQMTIKRPAASIVVGDVGRDYGLEGAPVQVARDKVTWQKPGEEPKENKYHDISAALPVRAGDDYYIALAEHANGTERGLNWCNPATGTFQLFDVGGPVCGLYGGSDAVYVVGSNGALLMVEPPLPAGQHLQTQVKLPRSLAEEVPRGEQITCSSDTVTIGNLVLKRRA